MSKINNVQSVKVDSSYLHLKIDGQNYRIAWANCSPKLLKASIAECRRFTLSPSGYGISWLELDEDLAIRPLLQFAEIITERSVRPLAQVGQPVSV